MLKENGNGNQYWVYSMVGGKRGAGFCYSTEDAAAKDYCARSAAGAKPVMVQRA